MWLISIFITFRDIPTKKRQVQCQPPPQEDRMHPLEAHRAPQAGGSSWCSGQPGWQVSFNSNFRWHHDFCTRCAAKVPWRKHYKFTDGYSVPVLVKILLRVQNQIDFCRKGREISKGYLCHTQWNQDFIWNTKRMNCTCRGKAQGQNQGHLISLFLTLLTVQVIQIQLPWVSHALVTEH